MFPNAYFCQIQCRGQAASALCICSKQYINSYSYSAEKQQKETKASPNRAPKTGAGAQEAALGQAPACGWLHCAVHKPSGDSWDDAALCGPES